MMSKTILFVSILGIAWAPLSSKDPKLPIEESVLPAPTSPPTLSISTVATEGLAEEEPVSPPTPPIPSTSNQWLLFHHFDALPPAEQRGFIELLSAAGAPPLQTPNHLEDIAGDLDLSNVDDLDREALNDLYQTALGITKEAIPSLMLLSKKWMPDDKALLQHTKVSEAQGVLRLAFSEHFPANRARTLSLDISNQALRTDEEALEESLRFFTHLPEALKSIIRLFIQTPEGLYAAKQEVWSLAPGTHGSVSGCVVAFRPFAKQQASPEVLSTLRVLEDIYFDWFTEPMDMRRLFDQLYAQTLDGFPTAKALHFFPFEDLPSYLKKSRDLYKKLLELADPLNDYERPTATHIPKDALANFLIRKNVVDALLTQELETATAEAEADVSEDTEPVPER